MQKKKKWSSTYTSYLLWYAAKSLQSCPTLCDPMMAAHQAPPSLGFSRQEHWSGLPFPSPMHESESESEVAQSCPTLSNPMDFSLPGSSVHGIFQARILEWGAIAFSDKCCYKQLKLKSYTVSRSQAHLNSSLFHILHTSQESTVASPGFNFLF